MNTYKALTTAAIAAFAEGVFEQEFTPVQEKDALDAGLLQIVPRTYKVLSNNFAEGAQGDEVKLALLVEQESALLQGGHIERVEKPVTTKEKGK
jgi:hypothetical protein